MSKYIHRLKLVVTICLCTGVTYAQDGHYWSSQYGTTSNLLSGVVIGSVNDLGAVYYNPGHLAMIDNPSFLLSTKVYQLETLTIENALGENRDLKDSNFGGVPELLAVSFDMKSLPKHRIAFSLLTRRQSEFDVLVRAQVPHQEIPTTTAPELITGEVRILTDVKEEWFGVTWSFKASDKVSFGISNFLTQRSKSNLFSVRFQSLTSADFITIFNRNRDFEMDNLGLMWKGGVSLDFSPVTLGLVITTPRINISGNGSYLYEDFFTGVDIDGDGVLDKVFSSNYQEDIDAIFKSPWAVGIGTGVSVGKATIHLSAEWYEKVSLYTLLDPEPFMRQSDDELIDIKVIDDLNDVLNFGIGVDIQLKDNLSVYASFATDFSAVKSDATNFLETEDITNNAATKTDFMHFAGGSSFTLKKVNFTLGLGYAIGDQTIGRPVNLPGGDNRPIFDDEDSAELKFTRLKFIFGFSIPIQNKSQG